jgi:hypothetical protein
MDGAAGTYNNGGWTARSTARPTSGLASPVRLFPEGIMAHQRGKPHGGRPKPHVDTRLPKIPKAPDRPGRPHGPQAPLVSRRAERGVPYPADWPNPLGGKTRGCF